MNDEDPRDLMNVQVVTSPKAPVIRVSGAPPSSQAGVSAGEDSLLCTIRSACLEVTIGLRSFDVAEIKAVKKGDAAMLRLQGESLRRLKLLRGPLAIEIAGRVFEASVRTQIAQFDGSADVLLQPVVEKEVKRNAETPSAVVVPVLPKKPTPVKVPTPLSEEEPGEPPPADEPPPPPLIADA